MKLPFVSIISAVRNEEEHIEDLIKSLLNLDYPKNKYEIIISDGLSTDRTAEIVRKFKRVKLLENKKEKTPFGRNLAIKNSKGEYIAVTDGDCIVDKNWLKVLVKEIISSPKEVVAAGGPNKIIESDPVISKVIGHMQETFLGSGGSAQSYKIKEKKYVNSIPNCNILYKKDIIERFGLYDETFDLGEDGELNFRLQKKGYKFLYLPDAIVNHHRRFTIPKLIRGMYIYGREMGKITKKHKAIARWYSLIPSAFLIFIIASIILCSLTNILVLNLIIYTIYYLYVIAVLATTIQVINKMSLNLAGLLTMVLLPIQHLSYGFGFLIGVL